jgi:nitrate reductase NapE component
MVWINLLITAREFPLNCCCMAVLRMLNYGCRSTSSDVTGIDGGLRRSLIPLAVEALPNAPMWRGMLTPAARLEVYRSVGRHSPYRASHPWFRISRLCRWPMFVAKVVVVGGFGFCAGFLAIVAARLAGQGSF